MIADCAPHPEYRDSCVAWLGAIPAHWDIQPGFAEFSQKQEKNVGLIESTVLSLSYGRIIVKPPEKLHGLVPASFETYQIIDPGDIIIRGTDLQNDKVSLRVGIARDRGIITSAYLCLKTRGELTPEYGYLLLHTYDLTKVLYRFGSGLRQNLDYSDFKRMPMLVPPPDEQAAIVRFLDHADRHIRRYIRAKRKLIALLNEQKQVIIQQAVTRGLDPTVPMKDSGVEWLAEIPAHWEAKPAKYYFREVDERSTAGDEELLSVSHITGVTPRSQKNITMFKAASYVGHKLCVRGDLVINTMWAWMGALGVARQTGIVSPSYAVYRLHNSDDFLPVFLDHMLRTKPYVSEYICRSTGIRSSRLRLYPEEFLTIPLFRPSLREQEEIVEFISRGTLHVDSQIRIVEREIELMQEYSTRLIADVVTGKLDVRKAARRLPDEPDDLDEADDLPLDELTGEEDDLAEWEGKPDAV